MQNELSQPTINKFVFIRIYTLSSKRNATARSYVSVTGRAGEFVLVWGGGHFVRGDFVRFPPTETTI